MYSSFTKYLVYKIYISQMDDKFQQRGLGSVRIAGRLVPRQRRRQRQLGRNPQQDGQDEGQRQR